MNEKKKQLIITILKMTGAYDLSSKSVYNAIISIKDKYKSLSTDSKKEEYENKVNDIVANFSFENYIDNLCKIYDKSFSEESLQKIIDFYNSDLGRKLNDKSIIKEVSNMQKDWFNRFETEIRAII